MEYVVLWGRDLDLLKQCVDRAMESSWQLQGGVCYDSGSDRYLQAMVKPKEA